MNTLIQNKHSDRCLPIKRAQLGFSLIEVMVAAMVLAIGVLGVVSLQVVGLKGTHQSYMKTQAMSIVRDVTERMHGNKLGVIRGEYLVDSTSFSCATPPQNSCNTVNANCTYSDIAKVDIHTIVCGHKQDSAPSVNGVKVAATGDKSPLVDGEIQITCPGGCNTGELLIQLSWQERNLHQSSDDEPEKDSLVVSTRIIK